MFARDYRRIEVWKGFVNINTNKNSTVYYLNRIIETMALENLTNFYFSGVN